MQRLAKNEKGIFQEQCTTGVVHRGMVGGNRGTNNKLGTAGWSKPLRAEAVHGLAGEVVGALNPHAESDPRGIVTQIWVALGIVLGRSPYFPVEAVKHYINLFILRFFGGQHARRIESLLG